MKQTKQTTIVIQEVTIQSGKTANIKITIDGKEVRISVPVEVKAYFNAQFVRANPTPEQKKRYATVMSLLRAAYQAGQKSS